MEVDGGSGESGGRWNWVGVEISQVEVDGAGWSWMHRLVIPVHKLSELNKRVNTEAAAHQCSAAVLKYQKQSLADVLRNWCS